MRSIAKSSGFSSNNELQRIIDAARSPEWSIGVGRGGEIMATKDSGEIGRPWVVTAARIGRAMRISLYQPGDDTDVEGEVIDEIKGNPREIGRQFRTILEETKLDSGG